MRGVREIALAGALLGVAATALEAQLRTTAPSAAPPVAPTVPPTIAPTSVAVRQPVLVGLLESPSVTNTRVKGTSITGTSVARVRANAAWTLRVALAAPIDPTLTATFRIGKGAGTTLSGKTPEAVVTTGSTPCRACAVTLEWDFTYRAQGPRRPTPVVPRLQFTALPTPPR